MKITAQPVPEKKKKPSLHVNMKTSGLKPKKNKKLSQQSVDAIVKVVNSPQGLVKKIKNIELANEKHKATTGPKHIKEKSLFKAKKANKTLRTSLVAENVILSNQSSKGVILSSKAVSKNAGKHCENVLKMVKPSQLADKIRIKQGLNSKKPREVAIANGQMCQDRKKVLKVKNLQNGLSSNSEVARKNLNKENRPQKVSHKKSQSCKAVEGGVIKANSVSANKDCRNDMMLYQELCKTILSAQRLMEIVRKLTLSTLENLNYSWAVTGSSLVDQFPTQRQVARAFLHHLQAVVYRGCLRSVECGQQQPHLVRPDVVASVGLLYTKLIRIALQDKQEFSNDLISLSGVVAAAWIDLTLFGKMDIPTKTDGSEDVLALANVVRTSVLRYLSCPDALEGGLDALLRSVYLRGHSSKSRKLARLLFGKYLQRVLSWNTISPPADSPDMPIPVYTKLLCAIKRLHNSQLPKNVSGFLARFLEGSSMPPCPPGLFAWNRSKNLSGSFITSKVTPTLVILRTMQVDTVIEAVYNEQYGAVTEEDEIPDSKPEKAPSKSKTKKDETSKPSSKDSLLLLREALREEAACTQLKGDGIDASVPAGKKRKNSVFLEEFQNENAATTDDYPPKPKTRKRRQKKKKPAAKEAEESPQSDDQLKKESSDGSSAGAEGDCKAEGVDPIKKMQINKHHKSVRSSKRNRALKKRAEKLAAAAASLGTDSTASDGNEETEPASKRVKLDEDLASGYVSKSTDSVVKVDPLRSSDKSKSSSGYDNSQRLIIKREAKSELSGRSDSQHTVDVDDSIDSDHETTIDLADSPVKFSKVKPKLVSRAAATNYDSDGSDIVMVEEVQGTSSGKTGSVQKEESDEVEEEEEEEDDTEEDKEKDESSDDENEKSGKNNHRKVKRVSRLDDEEEELHDVNDTKHMFTDKEVRKHNKKIRRKLEMLQRQDKENTIKKAQEEAAKLLTIKLEMEEKENAKRRKAFALDWSNYTQVIKPRKGGLSNQCNDLLNDLYKKKSAEQLAKVEYEKQREEERLEAYQQSVKKIKTKAKKELIKSALEEKVKKPAKPNVVIEEEEKPSKKKSKVVIEEEEKPSKKKSKSSRRKQKGDLQVVYSTVPNSTPSKDIKPCSEKINSEEPPKVKHDPSKKPSLSQTLDQVCITEMYQNKDYGKFLASVVSVSKAVEYQNEVSEKLCAEFGCAKAEVVDIDDVELVEAERVTADEDRGDETAAATSDKETEENFVDLENAAIEKETQESEGEEDEDEEAVTEESQESEEESDEDAFSDEETQECEEENDEDAVSDEGTQECEEENDDELGTVCDNETEGNEEDEDEESNADEEEPDAIDGETEVADDGDDGDDGTEAEFSTADDVCDDKWNAGDRTPQSAEAEEADQVSDDETAYSDEDSQRVVTLDEEQEGADLPKLYGESAEEPDQLVATENTQGSDEDDCDLDSEKSDEEDLSEDQACDDLQEEEEGVNLENGMVDLEGHNEEDCELFLEDESGIDLTGGKDSSGTAEMSEMKSASPSKPQNVHKTTAGKGQSVLTSKSSTPMTVIQSSKLGALSADLFTASASSITPPRSARRSPAGASKTPSSAAAAQVPSPSSVEALPPAEVLPMPRRLSASPDTKFVSPSKAANPTPKGVTPSPKFAIPIKIATPSPKVAAPCMVATPIKFATPTKVDTPSQKVATPFSNVATLTSNVTSASPKVATPSSKVATPSSKVVTPSSKLATPSSKIATPFRKVATPSHKVATPSPKVTTSSPKVATPSPKVATPSPKVGTPSPKFATPSPKVATPSPKVATPSPKAATPSPKVATPSPKVATPSPKVASHSPKVATPSPKVATPSPKFATPSPKVTTLSPKVATPSSKAATPSPKVATPSSKVATPSPKVATPSPKVATPSSKVATPSPKVATPSPKVATPFPKVATPSPKVATPSPKVATPSPKVATPSPKVATPSSIIASTVVSSTGQQDAKLTPSKTSAPSDGISSPRTAHAKKADTHNGRSPANKADQMNHDAAQEDALAKKSKHSSKTSTSFDNILESSSSPDSSDDLEIDTSVATFMDSEGVATVGKSPSAHKEDDEAIIAVASPDRKSILESSANRSISRLAKYTEHEGDELEIHTGDCFQLSPKSKLSPKSNVADLETALIIGQSKRKSIENLSSTPLQKKSRLSLSSTSGISSSPLQLSLSEMKKRAGVCSDVSIQLSRSIKTSPRLVSSAALTSEVVISPDLSDEETTAGKSDQDLFSDNEDMVVEEAFGTGSNIRSPIKATREEQEESDPIKTKKDTKNESAALLTTTPEPRKKSKLFGSAGKADHSQLLHSLLESPLLQRSSSKKTPKKTIKSSNSSGTSPILKLELEEDLCAKTESPVNSTVSKPDELCPKSDSASVTASDSADPAVKQSIRRLARRSSSAYDTLHESTTAASSINKSSSTEVFTSVTNIEVIKELGNGGIATRTRRRSVSSVSNADDDESSSNCAVIGCVSVAPRTRRRSISDLDALNTPSKKASGGAPSSLIGTIMEEEDGEDRASVSTTKFRPLPTTVATRRRSILNTPQKSSPMKVSSSLALELSAEGNTIPSSPTIGGRSRRASLSGAPVAGVAAPSTVTPRRRSLAVRSSSAAKAVESVTSSPARRVSKMKRLSESPERLNREEEATIDTEQESSEQVDEKVTEAKKAEEDDKENENSSPADDKGSSPSEVGSVSGDSAGGDAPRRTLRLRRQPMTYK